MENGDGIIVGIDVGMTNCTVACYRNGILSVLENAERNRSTASFVYVDGKTDKVGQFAKTISLTKFPGNGVYDFKRLIGRQYDDPDVQKALPKLSYYVQEESNKPIITINDRKNCIQETPVGICKIILKKIKNDIGTKLGIQGKVKAVITVPAYFNKKQCSATVKAIKASGIQITRVLQEPSAAALRYCFNLPVLNNNDLLLVFDLSGGSCNVSVLIIKNSNIEVVAIAGDNFLGGYNFDKLILEFIVENVTTMCQYDPTNDIIMMQILQNEAEAVKMHLTNFEYCDIRLGDIIPDIGIHDIRLYRYEFEYLADELFTSLIKIVTDCLFNNKIDKSKIKQVILSGGSTRIPKIQQLLLEYFDGKEIIKKYHYPEETVAEGAAILAAMLSEHPAQCIPPDKVSRLSTLLHKMTPLTFASTS